MRAHLITYAVTNFGSADSFSLASILTCDEIEAGEGEHLAGGALFPFPFPSVTDG